jgi:hypothetical protein
MSPWGGARKGAGRKPAPEGEKLVHVSLYLHRDLAGWLLARADRAGLSRSEFVARILARSRKASGRSR